MRQQDVLLLDQANCEKKAAATAVSLLHRTGDDDSFALDLTKIAREELKHLELVLKLINKRSIPVRHVSASRYAKALHEWIAKREPERQLDQLFGVCDDRSEVLRADCSATQRTDRSDARSLLEVTRRRRPTL